MHSEPTTDAIGFRVTEKAKVDEWALRAWLRQGERLAQAQATAEFNRDRFTAAVLEMRALTTAAPEIFWPRMQQLCADAGVALVALPHLPKTGANGVARWLNPRKAMIQLNLRYRWADIFWFTFFHEAAHVMQHQPKRVFVDLPGDDRQDEAEEQADEFATDVLIAPERWSDFVSTGDWSNAAIHRFADDVCLHAGIVVGRLQHEHRLKFHEQKRIANSAPFRINLS